MVMRILLLKTVQKQPFSKLVVNMGAIFFLGGVLGILLSVNAVEQQLLRGKEGIVWHGQFHMPCGRCHRSHQPLYGIPEAFALLFCSFASLISLVYWGWW